VRSNKIIYFIYSKIKLCLRAGILLCSFMYISVGLDYDFQHVNSEQVHVFSKYVLCDIKCLIGLNIDCCTRKYIIANYKCQKANHIAKRQKVLFRVFR
jgi:hypothetical protein